MAEAATAQIESLISQLQHEGLLDEQFSMLITLQDDDSPDFVVEVVQLYFEVGLDLCQRLIGFEANVKFVRISSRVFILVAGFC